MSNQQPDVEAPEQQQEQYDPWEAVEVVWDGGKSSSGYGGGSPLELRSTASSLEESAWQRRRSLPVQRTLDQSWC